MKLSREKLKKLILQEITTTKHRSRQPRGEKAAEMDFFGTPLEPSEEVLDNAAEKELLAMTMKRDDKADVAYRALFVNKDPIAWKVYNRFKAQNKNIFGNEKEFLDEYWDGPEAKARGKELFRQAQATKAAQPPAEVRKGNPMLGKFVRDTIREAFRSISLAETLNKELINDAREICVMKKSELLKIIREEVEVILTNEEAAEMFDLDVGALLDEIMDEAVMRPSMISVRKDPRTGKQDPMQQFQTPGKTYSDEDVDAGDYKKDLERQRKQHADWTATQGSGEFDIEKERKRREAAIAQNDRERKVTWRSTKTGRPIKEEDLEEDKDWIQKAVNPEHEGDCTPMTKKTCTPARKALAKRFKKAARKKKKEGGSGWQGKV
ncbi:hypothetical protein CMI37_35955 [Candidatus Pacearchaeota archaeon]|nr:hypothetical protein [Candidatus Pacearchaeota archaeon]